MQRNLCRTKFHAELVLQQTVSAFELFLPMPRKNVFSASQTKPLVIMQELNEIFQEDLLHPRQEPRQGRERDQPVPRPEGGDRDPEGQCHHPHQQTGGGRGGGG